VHADACRVDPWAATPWTRDRASRSTR
jgi:hypothetical protein